MSNEAFEKWAIDYGLDYESSFTRDDVEAAWQAAKASLKYETNPKWELDELQDLIANAPTVQREVSVFFEDDNKEVLCFEQYKPEHIVVVLDYTKGEFVQVLRPNADGTTSSKMYELATPKE